MQIPELLADNEHLIQVDLTSFGYLVTHKQGRRMVFTASYQREGEARRVASGIAHQHEAAGHTVWLCLNYAGIRTRS